MINVIVSFLRFRFIERNKRQENKRRVKVSDLHLKQSDSESNKPNQILNGENLTFNSLFE